MGEHEAGLRRVLRTPGWVLYGEWLYMKHSVRIPPPPPPHTHTHTRPKPPPPTPPHPTTTTTPPPPHLPPPRRPAEAHEGA